MIKSMTGFGRCEINNSKQRVVVELKSVNHRYFDLNIRMPRKLNMFEVSIRNLLKQRIKRGKVDLFITYDDYSDGTVYVKYNHDLASQYLQCIRQISTDFDLENDVRAAALSRYPDVLVAEDEMTDKDRIWKDLESALSNACDRLVEMREKEGAQLRKDLIQKLDHMLINVDEVEKRGPQIVEEHIQRLRDRVNEILGEVPLDESRLATEVVLYTDKICTDEETARLRSHILSMKRELDADHEIGRRLDFLAQEMNREANTILSKSNDLDTSNIAINLKTEIEMIREQIQNIE